MLRPEVNAVAIVQFGAFVSGIRGTLGGVTYSGNRSGAYVRPYARPLDPRSPKQEAVRSLASAVGAWWRALDQADRDAWDAWAAAGPQVQYNAFGDPYFLSGSQFGGRVQRWRQTAGLGFLAEPPTDSWPTQPPITGAAAVVAPPALSLVVSYPSATFEAGHFLVAFATPTFGPGAAAPGRGWRLIAAVEDPGDESEDLGAAYLAVFGLPEPGDRVHVRIAVQSPEGLRGPAFQTFADVEEA